MRKTAIAALCILISACSQQPTSKQVDAPATLRLTGSSSATPLVEAIAGRFCAEHPDVTITVDMGGSQRGITDAQSGAADIGMVSRALHQQERDLLSFAIARDSISLIVHKDNPIHGLTSAQVVAIFTGKTTNWKDLKGSDAQIVVFSREPKRPALEIFASHFKIEGIKAQRILSDSPEVVDAVCASPHAIAFLSFGGMEDSIKADKAIHALSLDGVQPTRESIRTGNYPIARPLMLVTKAVPEGLAREFIDYARSPVVIDLINKHNFLPYQD